MRHTRGLVLLLLLILCQLSSAAALRWTEGYIVHSQSPNGKYGVLIPAREKLNDEKTAFSNYLADLKSRHILGEIEAEEYIEGEKYRGIVVFWAKDSASCVLEYERRFGFASLVVVEINGAALIQTQIGDRVQKMLNGAIAKCSADPKAQGEAEAYVRIVSPRKVQVRATATDNPKDDADRKTCCALFQGTFDLDSKKWTVLDVRSISSDIEMAAVAAYRPDLSEGVSYSTAAQEAAALDRRMNEVYGFLRSILPAERFAVIKKEQIAWLKIRDAAKSIAEKSRLIEARIKELQDLAW